MHVALGLLRVLCRLTNNMIIWNRCSLQSKPRNSTQTKENKSRSTVKEIRPFSAHILCWVVYVFTFLIFHGIILEKCWLIKKSTVFLLINILKEWFGVCFGVVFFFVNAKNSPCVLLEFILSKDLHHGIRTQF